jgi:hypothetical protein
MPFLGEDRQGRVYDTSAYGLRGQEFLRSDLLLLRMVLVYGINWSPCSIISAHGAQVAPSGHLLGGANL